MKQAGTEPCPEGLSASEGSEWAFSFAPQAETLSAVERTAERVRTQFLKLGAAQGFRKSSVASLPSATVPSRHMKSARIDDREIPQSIPSSVPGQNKIFLPLDVTIQLRYYLLT
jgi:hypothetical protein